MTRPGTTQARVLAIDPTHRGFGYAVFEGPDLLVDWGERNIWGQKNAGSVEAVARLIERYQPDILVLEDPSSADCRRWPRVQLAHTPA
jgi:RNase H-fold protein (predicted Holliday junction resolvase)